MNTENNASRMVRAFQRKYGAASAEVFDIGDSVLVATRTEHEIKKLSQISITTMRKKNKLTAWSKKPFRITDKRMANGDDDDLTSKALSKKQQLAQMVPVNKTKKGHGSREWWATASKAERKVAMSYRYLLTNGKWYSPLNLLYLDPDVTYIPTEGKTAAWDKLKGSETAQQESEMDDSDIMAANIETENVAVASKIIAAMNGQAPPGFEFVPVKPSTRSTTKKMAGKKALPILDTVIPNFPGRLVRHPTEPKANLAGLVLRAVVTSRTKKGRYRVQISGSVPEKGGYRDRDDLALMDTRGLTAALVKKLQGLSEGKAASY